MGNETSQGSVAVTSGMAQVDGFNAGSQDQQVVKVMASEVTMSPAEPPATTKRPSLFGSTELGQPEELNFKQRTSTSSGSADIVETLTVELHEIPQLPLASSNNVTAPISDKAVATGSSSSDVTITKDDSAKRPEVPVRRPSRQNSLSSIASSVEVELNDLDLSHLSAEERAQIEAVVQRAKQLQELQDELQHQQQHWHHHPQASRFICIIATIHYWFV